MRPTRPQAGLTVLAAAAALLSGCSTAAAPLPGGATPAPQIKSVTIEPNDGFAPVDAYLKSATKTVDIVMYEIDVPFPQLTTTLEQLVKKGIKVRILLSRQMFVPPGAPPDDVNVVARKALRALGVDVEFSRPEFANEHQKSIAIDVGQPNQSVMISDFNLGPDYFMKSTKPEDKNEAGTRGMSVIDTDPNDIAIINEYFEADWPPYSAWPVSDSKNLVWAPSGSAYQPQGNAVAALTSFIKGAQQSLDIYAQEITPDSEMLAPILEQAKAGVKIRIVGNPGGSSPGAVQQLRAAGAQVVAGPKPIVGSNEFYYIHTKTMIADVGEENQLVFLGSENVFLNQSLNQERELGAFVTDAEAINRISSIFNSDFANSTVDPGESKP